MEITVCPKCQLTPHEHEDGTKVICVLQCDEDGTNAKGSECGTPWEELKQLLPAATT